VFAVLRVAVIAAAIAIAFAAMAWLVTGDARWRRRTWLVLRVSVFGLLVLLLLFAGQALLE
jgi:hypothetical protein